MEKEFNKLILEIIFDFIKEYKLIGYQPTLGFEHHHKKYIFNNNSYGSSLDSCIKDLEKFNIFKSLSEFNYYNDNYLIKFQGNWNLKLSHLFLNRFLNTEYENLFISSITKIIPINYCIEDQPWFIVKKFLITKPLKSNGLPEVENTKTFLKLLSSYSLEEDFENSFLKFCQFNKSLIKRTETQEYLKNFFHNYSKNPRFKDFFIELNEPLTQVKKDFSSIYINKKVLFSHCSELAINKKAPVDKLIEILKCLNKLKPKHTYFGSLFVEQEDERFEQLIIFISFNSEINYSFEDYYLYLLNYFLENKISIFDNLEKVSEYYFLNSKFPVKNMAKKEKTAKI